MISLKTILGTSVMSLTLFSIIGIPVFAHHPSQPHAVASHQDSSSTPASKVTASTHQHQLPQMMKKTTPSTDDHQPMMQTEQMEEMVKHCHGMMSMMMRMGNMNMDGMQQN